MDYMIHMEGMNNKVFSNIDIDPRDTIALAETESTLWYEDMIKMAQDTARNRHIST